MNYESTIYTVCTCICSDGVSLIVRIFDLGTELSNFTWACGIYNACLDMTKYLLGVEVTA